MQPDRTYNASRRSNPVTELGAIDVLEDLPRYLVAEGHLTQREALAAQATARHRHLPLEDVLVTPFGVSQRVVIMALADLHACRVIDPTLTPPDPRLMPVMGLSSAMAARLLPWRKVGDTTIVLACNPLSYDNNLPVLTQAFGPTRMALTTKPHFDQVVASTFGRTLAVKAEATTPEPLSCRTWNPKRAKFIAVGVGALLLGLGVWNLGLVFAGFTFIAVVFLLLNSLLKIAALFAYRKPRLARTVPKRDVLPSFSILVPLHDETAIADHLLQRLQAIDYPRELLDICMVLEADDKTTRHAIGQAVLPAFFRTIVVPDGTLKTKPRAMNYALGFAHGDIIGIYDAEDAPEPRQLHTVAEHFATARDDVACLQGTLDYYNAGSNWLTRCFALEYASWFRVMLPGLAKLGLIVPLGGTTLFFKRRILTEIGAWDAHNVTEDADLGIRLVRFGYRIEFVDTVTHEEANGRLWPWVKQRARWLKGYGITYVVHMRSPLKLLRSLGPWRFFGMQMLFAGTLVPFLLAPLLLSFWLILFGLPHPLSGVVPQPIIWALGALFFLSEILNILIAAIAVRRADKPWLAKWAPTLQFYFPLATIAAYRGLWELTRKPFYWDKTAHGIFTGAPPRPLERQASDGLHKQR